MLGWYHVSYHFDDGEGSAETKVSRILAGECVLHVQCRGINRLDCLLCLDDFGPLSVLRLLVTFAYYITI